MTDRQKAILFLARAARNTEGSQAILFDRVLVCVTLSHHLFGRPIQLSVNTGLVYNPTTHYNDIRKMLDARAANR